MLLSTRLQTPTGTNTRLDSVKWDDKGLAVAIAQHVDTGEVLMQGFANRDALASTISSKKATFYSRSRVFHLKYVALSQILYLGMPDGPSCHTGSETCYYTSVFDYLDGSHAEENKLAMTTLQSLEATIVQRKAEISEPSISKPSWTKRLLLDNKLLCSKIREEADELCRTLEDSEETPRTASEMADVLYHAMVLLSIREVKVEEVLTVLRQRFSRSGIEEKRSRK
ncbi:PRA-CH domain-containing protein [Heracleum sosnowskyi]|uniref:phosphoribosyl-ATP diphosphatase n=1 Tax=Heracleum sosnowskyi TaxID=360622 RepID=A0AAD8I2J3_9APIA|nr:PRA-CH domain-containing protein [Heracleum sosnowskyi]